LAISKERKREIIGEYQVWLRKSRAMVVAEYKGLTMNELDALRDKMREAGGEFHVVKNTLGKLAFIQAGLSVPDDYFEGSTAVGFAFQDAPAVAKALTDFARDSEFLKIKGGYLGAQTMSASEVKALADLPPLPVIRAQLMGVIMAPATRLARMLGEPALQVASVLKAYADRSAQPGAA
jgi:large subunit ribosomal protein L10